MKIVIFAVAVLIHYGSTQEYSYDTNNIFNGEYSYSYNDGYSQKSEKGTLNEEGKYVVTGRYSFKIGNKEYLVVYVADEKGYHPQISIPGVPLIPSTPRPQFLPPPPVPAPPGVVASLLG